MTLLIGTDEAGYGPNLGPLLISVTAWRVSDERDASRDLFDRLRDCVRADASSVEHIPITDSKRLYKPGGGLANLERGLYAAMSACDLQTDCWRDAWRVLTPADAKWLESIPWYEQFDCPLPIDLDDQRRRSDRVLFAEGLAAAGVSLQRIRSTAVFPGPFNDLLDRYQSKGSLLSLATLELVRDALAQHDDAKVLIQCDKHGGRNRYLAVLQTVFPDQPMRVVCEGRASSVYRWETTAQEVEIRFTAKGESFLPAALASMASKYLRELAMKAFNTFWQQHLPDLKPTAGYPADAKRFKAEIEATQKKLGIDERILWRAK